MDTSLRFLETESAIYLFVEKKKKETKRLSISCYLGNLKLTADVVLNSKCIVSPLIKTPMAIIASISLRTVVFDRALRGSQVKGQNSQSSHHFDTRIHLNELQAQGSS
jgi:hypothetical protein